MIQYILEAFAFQLVFLLAYDMFLRKETFFQWNRVYLFTTFALSLVLPWVKIEALKTTVSTEAVFYPQFLWQMSEVTLSPETQTTSFLNALSLYEWIFLFGAVVMAFWFGAKLYRIQRLRTKGTVKYYEGFTKVVVKHSTVAFSFFRQVFLGDGIAKEKEPQILAHELVHIKQWHSLDLLFFELLRIGLWFNPLVYLYQNRMAELHEFIADAQVSKHNKKEQYQLLLSEAFQTQNLSFVNQFFKQSLIKKRIVMLTKQKLKTVLQLKYALLLPLLLGMLVYASCERMLEEEYENRSLENVTENDASLIAEIQAEIDNNTDNELFEKHRKMWSRYKNEEDILTKEDYFRNDLYMRSLFVLVKEDNPDYDFSHQLPLPSTIRYESYVDRMKAFQILDNNLKISIQAYHQDIRSIENKDTYPSDYFVLEVPKVQKLQTNDIITFNNKMKEVFETGSSFKNIVVKDDEYAFHVYKKRYKHVEKTAVIEINEVVDKSKETEQVPFATVDEVPIFPGCENATDKVACFQEKIQKHIRKNFRYPEEAQENGVQGRVTIMFTIDSEGNITDIKKRGTHELLENEAVRIIEKLPQMQAGKHDGKAVNVPFSIPITFRLQNDIDSEIQKFPERDANWIPFALIDEAPIFPGCENAADSKTCFQENMIKHIKKHFNYPEEAQEKGIQGRVAIMFTIDSEGNIADIKKRGPNPILEEEAERIIKRLPKMQPARNNGQVADVVYSIPITFKLAGSSANAISSKINQNESLDSIKVSGSLDESGSIFIGQVSEGKKGLPGTNVSVKNSERGTISDFDGNFRIPAMKGEILVFQFKGLKPKHHKIGENDLE